MDNDKTDALKGEFIIGKSPESPPSHNETPVEKNQPHQEVARTELNQHHHKHFGLAEQKLGIHKNPHFYSSLAYFPNDTTFENQDQDEEIVLIVRQDFITNLPWILPAIALAVLPIILIPFLPIIVPSIVISQTTQLLYTLFYYLVLIGFVIVEFSLWYFQVGIVTTKRVIDVDVHGILIRDVSRALLREIQDVSYSQVGVIPSLFNYGDVRIQTAGEKVNFEFPRSPDPSLIIQIIQDLTERSENNGSGNI